MAAFKAPLEIVESPWEEDGRGTRGGFGVEPERGRVVVDTAPVAATSAFSWPSGV